MLTTPPWKPYSSDADRFHLQLLHGVGIGAIEHRAAGRRVVVDPLELIRVLVHVRPDMMKLRCRNSPGPRIAGAKFTVLNHDVRAAGSVQHFLIEGRSVPACRLSTTGRRLTR